ncbi:DNA/pantothenate metabolism flavoprotein [Leptospira perolatii]|uniref:DNA/pantothenate metabolism flavoprotein n=1 Tax=Leptospira perolatii TaxID=2023191 RepID=A0A2M9ZIQ1_9LEPT|nr:phosphopantothenoylcysteine decarboxylase [Leptospira perolatii]PJZ68345.1 DNA/pantothenate metabolism flavoprotein [Leptospira perolatii]PJZ71833.1 DNA/pantothenate metabolism flavoprotein [Leptospira perolatii]
MNIQKIIVSSGPTREWIDPVRFISNASSGKMGYSIAEAAFQWIPNVIYIRGLTQPEYSRPNGSKIISVETTLEMRDAVLSEMQSNTMLIMAAAPADFRPKESNDSKIKKEEGAEILTLELIKNPDILSSVSETVSRNRFEDVLLVGFSAETDDLHNYAMEKLRRKNLDYIVGNYVSRQEKGFGDLTTSVVIFGKDGTKLEYGPETKEAVASRVISYLRESALGSVSR